MFWTSAYPCFHKGMTYETKLEFDSEQPLKFVHQRMSAVSCMWSDGRVYVGIREPLVVCAGNYTQASVFQPT